MSLRWLTGTENSYNVIGMHCNPGFTIDQGTANALASIVSAAFASAVVAPQVDTSTSIATVGIRDLRTANQAEFFQATTGTTGNGAGEKVPNNIALCVTHRTSLAGKSFRGRSYMPFNAEASFDGETSLYLPAAGVAAAKFWTDIKAGLVSNPTTNGSLQLAVLSRGNPKATPPVEPRVTVIITSMVRSTLATTQRRRLPKRG
jgi:hypothetical protein